MRCCQVDSLTQTDLYILVTARLHDNQYILVTARLHYIQYILVTARLHNNQYILLDNYDWTTMIGQP